MSFFRIAWRSIQHRGLASSLTALSMAMGVTLVVMVVTIHGVIEQSFRTNSSLGYNVIVGAKGGKLQLTLNTVYYLSQPVENIKYDFYLEFFNQQHRDREYQNATKPRESREGKFAMFTSVAIPVCLGDYFGHFRVVGTTPDMFEKLQYGESADQPYKFAQGRNFVEKSPEHGFFEGVVGATVARERKLKLGDKITTTHGDPEGHGHGTEFTVVGILAPTGTPNDRAAFINMEGFFLMDGHAAPVEEGSAPPDESADLASPNLKPLPIEQREVTAILVRTISAAVTPGMQYTINKGRDAQCVLPIQEIYGLFNVIVGPIQTILLGLTVMICIVSGVSILVSIYNSMSERRREIAVMRALGASRWTVMCIILFESIMLSLGGGLLGMFGGHVLNQLASGEIESRTGVRIGFWQFAPPWEQFNFYWGDRSINFLYPELILIPGLVLLAIAVGFLPALRAYRTDVSHDL